MSKTLKAIVVVIILAVIGVAVGGYMFNKKVPGLKGVEPDFTMTADELFNSFNDDETTATSQYENKVILVSGEVMSVKTTDSTTNVVLIAENAMAGGVNCSFKSKVESVAKGDEVSIKGKCQGFLMDVVLNNCVIE